MRTSLASALVAVTASSLGLVTSVPLARIGLDSVRRRAPRRVVVLARARRRGGAAGVFALAGAAIAGGGVLGAAYAADVGDEIGRLVAPFAVDGRGGRVLGDVPARLRAAAGRASARSSRGRARAHVPTRLGGADPRRSVGPGDRARGVHRPRARVMLHLLDAVLATVVELLPRRAVVGRQLRRLRVRCPALVPAAAATLALVVYAVAVLARPAAGLMRSWAYLRALR